MPMKHVGTAAPSRQIIVVTGFGAFPGARRTPTLAILAGLERHRARLARLGIDLRCAALPVVYDAVEPALRAAIGNARPDAILHLGLASRRRTITIETRALNRASPLHPDAAHLRPAQVLVRGGSHVLRATTPGPRLRAALIGHGARLSIDAGVYVRNATLYRSLASGLAPCVGFIHIPRPRERRPPAMVGLQGPGGRDTRPSLAAMTDAVLLAVLIVARNSASVTTLGAASGRALS